MSINAGTITHVPESPTSHMPGPKNSPDARPLIVTMYGEGSYYRIVFHSSFNRERLPLLVILRLLTFVFV